MKTLPTLVTATGALILATYQASIGQGERFDPPKGVASRALQILDGALKGSAGSEATGESLIAAARGALQLLPEHSPVADQLVDAISRQRESGDVDDLVQAIKKVSSMLAFQPQREADLPVGFPTFTPVGMVEIKEYPAYRKAVGGQFWTLFRHIQTNSIAMTAPVEMKYGPGPSGQLSQQSMAFLYGNVEIGQLGKDGKVDVVDVEPLTVVSIGVRGKRNREVVDQAHRYLLRWLEAHPDLVASDSPRVMGYNSPMVRQGDSFFEVQIPVRKSDAG